MNPFSIVKVSRIFLALAAVSGALVLAVRGAGATDAASGAVFRASRVETISAGPRGVQFEYVPGSGRRAVVTDILGDAEHLEFEAASTAGERGAPHLPYRTERIALPDGADYTVEFTVEGERIVTGLRFPIREPITWRRDARRPAEVVPPSDLPPAADRFLPESPVSWRVEEFRGRRLLFVTLAPLQYNAATGETRLFEKIGVRVGFSGSGAGAKRPLGARTVPDPAFDNSPAGLVLNPAAAAAVRTPATPSLAPLSRPSGAGAGIPENYFDDAPVWIRIRIGKNGVYRVTGSDLEQAGAAIATIDPATIRLFSGSGRQLPEEVNESASPAWGHRSGFREIAATVRNSGAAGQFDRADEVLFYALGVDNFLSWYDASLPDTWVEHEYENDNVIWLTWNTSMSGDPLRIPEVDAVPLEGDPVVRVVQDLLHAEVNDPITYDPVPYEVGARWEKWWWQLIENSGTSYFWDVDLPDVDTSRRGSFLARWWGSNLPAWSPADPTQNHFLNVRLNSDSVSTQWGGGIVRKDVAIDDVVLRARNRVLGQVPRLPGNPNRSDQILLAWFEFTYWKTLSLARNTVWFEGTSAAPGPVQFQITGAASGAHVYDVTDPGRPVRLDGSLAAEGAGQVLSFRVSDPDGRRFVAVNPAGIATPTDIEIDSRPARWLRATDEAVDYLIITGDEFQAAAATLAAWRRNHLTGITGARPARVSVVKVSDIYDEFSGGLVDPTAIRNFIQYVYNNWGGENPEDPPVSYVCLIGDANRDGRDREGTGVRNFVPTWQGGIERISGFLGGVDQFSTDEYYARLGGTGDLRGDVIIGRIPVLTESQARAVVEQKIIRSEQFPGMNPYRNRAILVADDVCQIGRSDGLGLLHLVQTESVGTAVRPPFDVKKIYLYEYGGNDCTVHFKPGAKRDLIQAMNEGGWLVNYIGHGSDQQMADEKVLEVTDVTTLNNRDQLPILIAASCSVGKFDRPNTEGLAEVLIKTPSGGAIGAMAATYLSYPTENAQLNLAVLRSLFPDPANPNRSTTTGKALFDAKILIGSRTSESKYLLLGDPGSNVIAPATPIRITDPPDTLARGAVVTINGEVLDASGAVDEGFNGAVDLLVQDQPNVKKAFNATGGSSRDYVLPGATIFSGRGPVQNGRFAMTFVVPVSLRGGPAGRVRAYAASQERDASGALNSVVIGGIAEAAGDTTAPVVSVSVPNGAAPGRLIEAVIDDASGINLTRLFEFRSVQMTILDEDDFERFQADVTDGFSYDEGSYTRGRVRTTLPELPSGRYTVRISATDNYNNRGEGSLAISLRGAGELTGVGELYGLPNPFAQATEISWALSEPGSVRLSIFSVGGRKVREWSIDGAAGENRLPWDGTDARGDAVANGVYLVRIAFRPTAGGESTDIVEPIVRMR